jgi:hypothetical protein
VPKPADSDIRKSFLSKEQICDRLCAGTTPFRLAYWMRTEKCWNSTREVTVCRAALRVSFGKIIHHRLFSPPQAQITRRTQVDETGEERAGRRRLRSAQASLTSTRFPLRRISWLARHAGCGHAIETYRGLFEPLFLMNEMLKIRPHASHGR